MPAVWCRGYSSLLLASVVLMAVSFASSTSWSQTYQSDIDRWVAQDALDPPAAGAILFTGSSSIGRWEQLAQDFADYEIIQRGFGGSQFEQLNGFVNDIVLPYRPAAIVVWSGTNDLGTGESAAEVLVDYQTFTSTVHAAQPALDIFYLGITPTPANSGSTAERDATNTLISAAAATDARLHYIDLPSYFYGLSSAEFDAAYIDNAHLTRHGYEQWTALIRPEIEAVISPNKVFTPNPLLPGVGTEIFFDFGPSNTEDGDPTLGPDANGNIWNNWHPADGNVSINAGEHLSNLVDAEGIETGIDLIITGTFNSNGKLNGGLLTPESSNLGDFAVGTATQDYFFSTANDIRSGGNLDDALAGGFMLDGLDPELVYDFEFFGSRLSSATRSTEYAVFGDNEGADVLVTTGLNIGADGIYDGNDDQTALVSGIRPDAFGQVFVDITLIEGSFAHLNAMRITVVPEPRLYAVFIAMVLCIHRRSGGLEALVGRKIGFSHA
ncbi:MAG: GDSL-type esterase/lipase family protein [Planctomycetota bacterium]